MLRLDDKIEIIPYIGKGVARKMERLGVSNVRDLLFYFPVRYDDFSQSASIKDLRPGERANLIGRILLIQNKRSPKKRLNITEALIADDSGEIRAVWFNQPFLARSLKEGDEVSLSGKVEEDYSGLVIKSPSYEKNTQNNINTQGVVPNYGLTEGLTQKQVRYLVRAALDAARLIADWLPEEVIKDNKLLSRAEAVRLIHFPENLREAEAARRRFAFEEIFTVQLRSGLNKQEFISLRADSIPFQEAETKRFVSGLPFQLTDAQKKSAWAILRDLGKDRPMSRLLEGDVGSGKTIVAVLAALNAAVAGRQAAIMVPTAILATQHYNKISELLKGFAFGIGLITNSQKALTQGGQEVKAEKGKKWKAAEVAAQAKIIIGTHALIQEKVRFPDLALAVIDEQHRFGVAQRAQLLEKGNGQAMPHLLSMTATPIPRSLALVLFGDLDISLLNEMPKGRKKIITRVVEDQQRQQAYDFIKAEIKKGRQAFVICPLIDISDKLGVRSAKEEYEKLNKLIFPNLTIGLLHGRMKAEDKDAAMADFLAGRTDILVATSVVEVGVDVPNATIMMIEGSDRFGLAQLHQFRGRVGRGEHQSYCLLFSDSPALSVRERLGTLVNCEDGFALAKMDLKFRGPGEVYGTAQKGFPEFKVATLFDHELIAAAKQAVDQLLARDPKLDRWPRLKERLTGPENWLLN